MKVGDYLICKKSYYLHYEEDNIKNKFYRLFKTPNFKSGKKYLIIDFLVNDDYPYVINCKFYKCEIKIKFDNDFISKYFYSKIEERKLKLKKIKPV